MSDIDAIINTLQRKIVELEDNIEDDYDQGAYAAYSTALNIVLEHR